MVKKETIKQFFKFAVVGGINTAIDWLVFLILTSIFISKDFELYAKAIAFVLAVLNSFFINSKWTFKKEYSNVNKKTVFLKFFLVSFIGLAINSGIFSFFRFDLNQTKIISLFFATLFSLSWNFLANKLWTYKKNV